MPDEKAPPETTADDTASPTKKKRKTLADIMRGGPMPLSEEDRRFLDSTVGREV